MHLKQYLISYVYAAEQTTPCMMIIIYFPSRIVIIVCPLSVQHTQSTQNIAIIYAHFKVCVYFYMFVCLYIFRTNQVQHTWPTKVCTSVCILNT